MIRCLQRRCYAMFLPKEPAQPVSRSMVAQAGNVVWQGQRPEIHAGHHVREVSLSRRAGARRTRRQLCCRAARRSDRRRSVKARRIARPLDQPTRVGRVDQRTGPRLPSTSGAPKPSRIGATQEAYPNQPLQQPASVARRCTPCRRRGSSSGLRLAPEKLGRRRFARTDVVRPMWLRELIESTG